MKSFGVWYKGNNDIHDINNVDLHINVWDISRRGRRKPFIDIGVRIRNFNEGEMVLLFPFLFLKNEMEDLYDRINSPNMVRLIFNNIKYEIESSGNYIYVKDGEGDEKFLLVNILKDCNFIDGFDLESYDSDEITILKINFNKLTCEKVINEADDIYFRFRINCEDIRKKIFSKLRKKNLFLESGFYANEIVDIKINQVRNLPFDFSNKMTVWKYEFVEFSKVHLLLMTDSRADVACYGEGNYDCRRLETNEWNSYVPDEYDISDVLAFHWREKGKVSDFNKLIKVSFSTTNWGVILLYVAVAIFISAVGGIIANCLD